MTNPKTKSLTASCVEGGCPTPRRLNGPEAIVIIVVIGTAAVLVALGSLTVADALQLLGGAGLLAALIVAVGTGATGIRRVLRMLSLSASTV